MKKKRSVYIVGICIVAVILVTVGLVVYTLFNGSKVTADDKKEVEELLETVLRTAYIEKDYEKADTLFYPELNEEDMLCLQLEVFYWLWEWGLLQCICKKIACVR